MSVAWSASNVSNIVRLSHQLIDMSIFTQLRFTGLVLVAFMVAPVTNASDDAYLKMLEGEAETLELDQTGQLHDDVAQAAVRKSHTEKAFGWDSAIDADSFPVAMQYDEFETMLQDNFYGTYMFYKKLNSADRQTVYYRYTKAEVASLENVRKNILDLLKR